MHRMSTRRDLRLRLRGAAALTALSALLALPAAGRAQEGGGSTETPMPSCHSLPAEGGQDHAAMGHEAHADMAKGQPAADAAEEARLRIPDMDLLDQDGRPVHFYRDLVEDKVVAMNFIFTTCTTICPPMGANFSRLQEALGEHLGRDVQLISVSIDPTTDTPQRLKAWGEKFSASDAWTLVTGPKPDVDQVLRQLEVLSPDFKDHGPVALLINDRTGAVRRVNGLTPPAKLAAMLEEMMDTPEAPTEETAR